MTILDPRTARKDLTSRECAKILGGVIGGLVELASLEDLHTAVEWWANTPGAWKAFEAFKEVAERGKES